MYSQSARFLRSSSECAHTALRRYLRASVSPSIRLALIQARLYASRKSRDAIQITKEQNRATQPADKPIFTLQEYLDKDDPSQLNARQRIADKVDEVTDNPMWMIYGLMFVAILILNLIISSRLRREVTQFDPRMRQVTRVVEKGGVRIGGDFELTDTEGRTVRSEDLRGKWLYVYFGFINCPDICPAEMQKMTRVIRGLDNKIGKDRWQPIFISIDPERDTPEMLKDYLSDFHPRIMGLTGTPEQIERIAKKYKVFYSIPDENSNPDDYLIDHSIMTYIMGPDGKFVDYTTKDFNWTEALGKIYRRIFDHDKELEQQKRQEAYEKAEKIRKEEGNKSMRTAARR